jgi:hypothetical protein
MSQVSKLNQVNSKLGAGMMGQQTTRYVFDSVDSELNQTFFEFFKNFNGKNEFQTNLTTNKLDSSESMVIKSIFLSSSATTIFPNHCLLNITVGNQVVIKDLDISYNSTNRGVSFDRLHSSNTDNNTSEIRLLTDIIIPPQVNFQATLQIPQVNLLADQNITLGLKGYGVIFSAGNTF